MSRVLSVAFALLVLCAANTAYAAYVPSLTSPSDGAAISPDGQNFSWIAPSDAVDSYRLQISTGSSFSALLFDYTVAVGTTTRNCAGLPGSMTLYWRVVGVVGATQYPSPYRTASTVADSDGPATVSLFSDNFSTFNSSVWALSGNTSMLFYDSTYGCIHGRYWSYSQVAAYLTTVNKIAFPTAVSTLTYKYSHYYYGSYPNDALYVQYSLNGSTWVTFQTLIQSTFNSGQTSVTTPPVWATTSIAIPAAILGQMAYLRFYFFAGYGPDAYIDEVKIEFSGKSFNVSTPRGNPSPAAGTSYYPMGTAINCSVESMIFISGSTDSRYACTGWTGTGSVPDVGTSNSFTLYMYRNSTIVWQWKLQYTLTVTSDGGKGNISPYGTIWYDNGTIVTVKNDLAIVPTGTDGVRWYNTGWVGTGSCPSSGLGQEVTFAVSAPSTCNFVWMYNFRLKILNPLNIGDPVPTAGDNWYSDGTRVPFQIAPFVNLGTGTAYSISGWRGTGAVQDGSGSSGEVTMTKVSTLEWQWNAQYYLTIISQYGRTTGNDNGWYAQDSILTASCAQFYQPLLDVRYECRGWLGSGSVFDGVGLSTGNFRIIAPTSIEWRWFKEYHVTVSSNYGVTNPSGSTWVDEGGTLGVVAFPLTNTDNTRYNWGGWVGTGLPTDPTGNLNNSFVITGVSSFSAVWYVDFYVAVRSDLGTFDDDYDGWYRKGTLLTITAIAPTAPDGHRHVCGWRGTGSVAVNLPAANSTSLTVNLDIEGPINQEAFWVGQIRFDVINPQGIGELVPAAGSHWFFVGDLVEGYSPFDVNGIRCTGFDGTGSIASSSACWYSFLIFVPSSVTFSYEIPGEVPEFTWNLPETVASSINGHVLAMKRKASDGSPIVIFHNPNTGKLESCYYLSGVWYSQTVDTIGSGETWVSMVLDSYDIPHILYFDTVSSSLKYAFFDSNFWRSKTVDGTPGAGRYNSIAIDRFGNLYVAYYNLEDSHLYFATSGASSAVGKGDVWSIESIDTDGNVGLFCSVAVSQLWAEPHIAYYDSSNGDLKHAFRPTGDANWTVERAATDGDIGVNASIVLDPSGRPAISAQENSVTTGGQGLVFCIRRDTGWQTISLDAVGVTGFNSSMAVDQLGNYHIAYNNFGGLVYARFNGLIWSVNNVFNGEVTDGTSLSLDANGNPGVLFWDNGDLKYVDVTSGKFTGAIVNYFPASQGGGNVNPSGGGGCFIATAAFGSYSADCVICLTDARDRWVSAYETGRSLVESYYLISPNLIPAAGKPSVSAVLRAWMSR
ncbi:MAG: CFI-box-CTERM domain-containing protein [Candidatus Brocadiia bacterium]